ncbi:MAG: alpha-amylase [Bacteroidales bacterium]|nr:alpha-amylase [Bacteroidales bacterium]
MKANGTMMQFFHWYYGSAESDPGLWEKVRQEAKRLSALGITALWLPPAFKCSSYNEKGRNAYEKYDVGYGIYDLYDLGEFNQKGTLRTKYGTKEQYIAAINEAHKNGIDVYADVVLNHKAGADETEWVKAAKVDWNDRNFVIKNELWIEAWTKFNFEGRANKYSGFKWSFNHFDGVDWANNLDESEAKGIFKFQVIGKDWAKMVSGEKGNYDYLMFSDIDMNNPEVRTELARWGKWFLKTTGVDGFRLDAVKHIQFSFFRDWIKFLKREFPDLFAVGEYWSSNIGELQYYIQMTEGCMSLFDAPLQNNFYQASRTPDGGYDMRCILDNTLVKNNPVLAVTIVDNHDTQPCQALERFVDWWFKPLAYAITLLRQEGYPSVFYPDLYGAEYEDKGCKIKILPVKNIEKLITVRKLYAYGKQRDYLDNKNTIGWIREGDDAHAGSGVAVLMTNGTSSSKWMEIGKKYAGRQLYDFLGNCEGTVTVNKDGWSEFRVNGNSVSAWVLK